MGNFGGDQYYDDRGAFTEDQGLNHSFNQSLSRHKFNQLRHMNKLPRKKFKKGNFRKNYFKNPSIDSFFNYNGRSESNM